MLNKINKWFGGGKKGEAYMAEPRRVPDEFSGRNAEIVGLSQEFALKERPNERFYLVVHEVMGSFYRLTRCSYDLNDHMESAAEPDKKLSNHFHLVPGSSCTGIMDAIQAIMSQEKEMRQNDLFVPVPESRQTYRRLANVHGLHFDADGRVFVVPTDAPVDRAMIVGKEGLANIFNPAVEDRKFSDWKDLYGFFVKTLPTHEQLDDLRNDSSFNDTVKKSLERMTAKLEGLPAYINNPDAGYFDKTRVVEDIYWTTTIDYSAFKTAQSRDAIQKICDASILIAVLRAGAAAITKAFSAPPEEKISAEQLQLVIVLEYAAKRIATSRLGMSKKNAESLSDIMAKGPDPFGQDLPVSRIFQKGVVPDQVISTPDL